MKNLAVSSYYEPGSTFKLVTYSAALDQKVVTPDDIIDCQGGKITLAGRVIHDEKGEHFGRVPVHEALEHSSDVAAVKLALKVGPALFYQYIRDFGFGARTGAEMPGEIRGLLRPVNKWSGSSIGSLAIGQEIGITPLQLVTMVSTIANGGVYLPPHVVMPGQLGPGGSTPKATPFVPGGDDPNPLPAGAHRVISTMTAARMRKMMEGVVLFGTGKEAQLNGYSSGGKTGTAQKIDTTTKPHTYSKTMHIASFAGFAPVNNPAIAVAVIMDTPKGEYHGATVSAPVFAEVAQQVLEYIGVPHDIDIRPIRPGSKSPLRLAEDEAPGSTGDIHALDLAASELPSDDPLHASQSGPATTSPAANGITAPQARAVADGIKQEAGKTTQGPVVETVVSQAGRVPVPSFLGMTVRQVIEQAASAGFAVEVDGNGAAREQNPVPGTMVEPGARIQVHCRR
jgi:cell division protein FtsI (penicillin-binding protein 3)